LNVLSEPPGIDVQLDGIVIGKTPIFSTQLTPGSHVLRMKGSETDIYLDAGKTFTITWFKGSFIKIPKRPNLLLKSPKSLNRHRRNPKQMKGQAFIRRL